MTVLMLAATLADRCFETLEDLVTTINYADGRECVNLLIHDGVITTLYSPSDIERFNDEFLSQDIKSISTSCIGGPHSIVFHVTI